MNPSVPDIVEVLSIEKVSVFGLLILIIIVLSYFVKRLQTNIDTLRENHRLEIQALNDAHAKKIEELTKELVAEIRRNAEVYQHSTTALEMILKTMKKNDSQ